MAGYQWAFALAGGILLVELLTGRHRGIHHRQDYLVIGSALLASQLTRPLLAVMSSALFALVVPAYKGLLADWPVWLAFVMLLLVGELWQYWLHRAAHNSVRHKILSGMHRTHHSAPYVNVSVMVRVNLAWSLMHPYAWMTAIAFYLGQPLAATAFYLSLFSWNALTHSDWCWDEYISKNMPGGRHVVSVLEHVFITPKMHHAHHGYGKNGRAYNNFSTMISMWDRMFGTLFIPEGRPMFYGLPGGEHEWYRQILYPFIPLGETQTYRPHRRSADVEAQRLAQQRGRPQPRQEHAQ